MRPKVSIIVPIYNVEKYLSRCLDSLLVQTLQEIEIIAVNDGSNDSSLKILRKYEIRDSRIKVIEKLNGGVSSARNEGIWFATGEYIGFVDPDDWVNPEMYEEMYKNATSENIDIVMCSYIREFENHSKIKDFNLPNRFRYQDEEVKKNFMRRLIGPINEEIANPEFLDAWGTVWSKLYRAEIIMENNIEFMDLNKIGTNEDTLFNIEAAYYAKSFLFLNCPYYHYWRANSTSVTSGYKPKLMDQWMYLFMYIENFLRDKKMNKDYYLALNNRICLNTLGLGLNTISKDNLSSSIMKIRRINMFLKEKRIRQSFKQLDLSKFPFVWRVFYFFAKVRFAAGFYFMLVCIEFLRKIIR
ncbi:glycosyltransferase [Bacillus sp. ISL-40]|uniref:glycosyltransferase n=1 Tax=unclassified Bacillus (in: firmicutes) TaxID=185979 RepID=UPI001BEAC219|nr:MULTISPECIES: glycosyltransferase [unclassified Bacillus (in: firmicutes)]MBT2699463.1 glycosyltransferase [Bacillus sp. ISL-40]MBT2721993.1 glycosyltransferase [Bacillus sp. ISL-46]MBT2741658.1 glycosyltransferase [Bacillus sp. ISL-77]